MGAVHPIYSNPADTEKGELEKMAQFNLVHLRKTWKIKQHGKEASEECLEKFPSI